MKQEGLQRLVDTKINLGMSYQAIYDELIAQMPGQELELAAMIAELSSKKQRQEFRIWQILMVFAVAAAIVLQVVSAVDFYLRIEGVLTMFVALTVLVFGFLLRQIVIWRSTSYKIIGYAALVLMALWAWADSSWWYWGQMVAYPLVGFLGIYLETQLGGKYKKIFRGHKDGPKGTLAVYEIRFTND